jgi:hypothetical protein
VQARHFVPVRLTDPPLQAPATAPPVNNHLARDTIEIVLPYKAAACASAAALT